MDDKSERNLYDNIYVIGNNYDGCLLTGDNDDDD